MRASWLRERGLDDSPYTTFRKPDSGSGLSCIGRWSYGPSYDVDGRTTPTETLIALARGSGVSLIRYSRSATPHVQLVSDINCSYLVTQVKLLDTLLLAGTRYGVELYNVANPTSPARLASIQTPLNAFDVRETLLCVAGPDTFSVYDVSAPSAPHRLGYYLESGADVSIAGQAAYVADVGGLRVVDISNPVSPHRVGAWGGRVISVAARNTICCVTQDNANQPTWLRFSILDVSNPASIQTLSYIDSCGGYDTRLDDSLVFLSGYYTGGHEFRVIDIADSVHPASLGRLATLGENFGVWGSSAGRLAAVADNFGGLDVVSTTDLTAPALDTLCYRVGLSLDMSLSGHECYVASDGAGMKVLDMTNPASPLWIGDVDESYGGLINNAVAARDSFAFVCWWEPWLRVIDVTDPTQPVMTASLQLFGNPEDMVLHDSFLYVAEDYRFQIVNVARPRAPQVVGTCNLQSASMELIVADTLAYVANWPLEILSIADPSHPYEVGSWPRSSTGIDLQDTVLYVVKYVSGQGDALYSLSVADLVAPYQLDSVVLTSPSGVLHDVLVVDTIAYCAGYNTDVIAVSVANPANLRVIGPVWSPPNWVRRLVYEAPYIYAACTDGGVCVLETLQVGITEEWAAGGTRAAVGMRGSVVRDELVIALPAAGGSDVMLSAYDMSGRCVEASVLPAQGQEVRYSFARLPAGVYVLRVRCAGQTQSFKVVKL